MYTGSTDSTCALATQSGAHTVLHSAPGRSACLRAGAAAASGDVLLFLHSDTKVPVGWPAMVRAGVRHKEHVVGWGVGGCL